jgi:hypothetical protein
LQTFADAASRVTVICVDWSLMTRLPLASCTSTVRVEVETASAAIGFGENDEAVFVAAPMAPDAMITLQPVAEPDVGAAEIWMLPDVVVDVTVRVATPEDGVAGFVPDRVPVVGVLLLNWIVGVLAFETVLPFASFSVAETIAVLVPFAVSEVGFEEHDSDETGPKTVIGATAVRPSELEATTLHGWVAEFVEVAAKRPALVTAPQPPVTDQLIVAPVPAPLAVNCWVPPTGIEAEAGEMVRPPPAEGVLFCWK